MNSQLRLGHISAVDQKTVEKIVEQFEVAWQMAASPVIEDFVPETEHLRIVVIIELVHSDLDFRIKAGERVRIEEFLNRFPELHKDDETFRELVEAEYHIRQRQEPLLNTSEYWTRFPEQHQLLRQIFPDQVMVAATGHSFDSSQSPKEEMTNPLKTRRDPTSIQGKQFGDYVLIDEIARGGMGVVFKAEQKRLHRVVALKMILAGQLATEDDINRFQQEAEAAAKLEHPNIVPIYEVGEHNQRHYLSMGLIDGNSLADQLKESPLPPKKATRVLIAVTEAVAYGHDQGIVHRDLKPDNILMDINEQPRVTDFGLAKSLDVSSGLTVTGQIMGTPSYMPPEQARGDHSAINQISDVYSLGAVLYATLTGRPPFQAANAMDTLKLVLEQEPVSPRQLNPAVDADLETICLKCLSKEKAGRYQSAIALVEELGRYQSGKPILARPIRMPARGWRWCKRNSLVSSLMAIFLISLCVGTGTSTYFAIKASHRAGEEAKQRLIAQQKEREANEYREEEQLQRLKAEEARSAETIARRKVEVQAEEMRWQLYVSQMYPTINTWQSGKYGHLEQLLNQSIPRKGQSDYRGWEWYYLRHQIQKNSTLLEPDNATPRISKRMAWNTRTGELAVNYGKQIEVWNPVDHVRLRTLTHHVGSMSSNLVWSSDNSKIAYGNAHGELIVLNAVSGKELFRIEAHTDRNRYKNITAVDWSPDGLKIVTANRHGDIKVWNAKDGELFVNLYRSVDVDFTGSVAWHPDSNRLAVGHRMGQRSVWDIKTQKRLRGRRVNLGVGRAIAWSPNGNLVAASNHKDIVIFDKKMKRVQILSKHHGDVNSLLWFDEKHVISAGADQTIRIWNLDLATSKILHLHTAQIKEIALGPNKQWVASRSINGKLKLTRLGDSSTSPTVLKAGTGLVSKILWHPENKLQFAAVQLVKKNTNQSIHYGGRISVWKLSHKPHVRSIPISIPRGVGWSSDGKSLISTPYDNDVINWNLETNNVEKHAVRFGELTGATKFSPDAKYLARSSEEDDRSYLELRNGRTLKLLGRILENFKCHCISWHCESTLLAVANSYSIMIIDIPSCKVICKSNVKIQLPQLDWDTDGECLVVGGESGRLQILDAVTLEIVCTLHGLEGTVTSVDWSPDGRRIAACGSDGKVHIYDAATGDHLIALTTANSASLSCISWSNNGQRLAAGSDKGEIYVWDAPQSEKEFRNAIGLPTGIIAKWKKEIKESGHTLLTKIRPSITPDKSNRNKNEIISVSTQREEQRKSTVIELKLLTMFPVGEKTVTSVDFSPDGKLLATANFGGPVRLWKIGSDTPEVVKVFSDPGRIQFARFSPDGKFVLSGGRDQKLTLWDMVKQTKHWEKGDRRQRYLDVAFTPDGKRIVAGRYGIQDIEILEATSGELISVLDSASYKFKTDNPSWPCVTISPDGKLIATVVGGINRDEDVGGIAELTIWDATSLQKLSQIPIHKRRELDISFSHDSKFVATAGASGTTKLWSIEDIVRKATVTSSAEIDSLFKYLNDDDFSIRQKASDRLTKNGLRIVTRLQAEIENSTSTFFRLRARHLLNTITQQHTDSRILGPKTANVAAVAFAPYRKVLASGRPSAGANHIKLWDLSNGDREFFVPNDKNGAQAIAFSHDGKLMATGSLNGMVSIWHVVEKPVNSSKLTSNNSNLKSD